MISKSRLHLIWSVSKKSSAVLRLSRIGGCFGTRGGCFILEHLWKVFDWQPGSKTLGRNILCTYLMRYKVKNVWGRMDCKVWGRIRQWSEELIYGFWLENPCYPPPPPPPITFQKMLQEKYTWHTIISKWNKGHNYISYAYLKSTE